jgi:hypothetical protein
VNTDADAMRMMLVEPEKPGVANALAMLGVTRVVTHSASGTAFDLSGHNGYQLLAASDGVQLWRVVAPAARAVASYGVGDVAEPVSDVPGGVGYPMTGNRARVQVIARESGVWVMRIDVRLLDGRGTLVVGGKEGSRRVQLRDRTSVVVPIKVERGRSVISLWVERAGVRGVPDPADVVLSRVDLQSARTVPASPVAAALMSPTTGVEPHG